MKAVAPKIFFLGEPKMHMGTEDDPGVLQWLDHVGGAAAVACLEHVTGSDEEKIIELAARRCYKSYAPGLNPNVKKVREDSAEYHANIAKNAHGSVVAHGHLTYAFEDVARVFTHEIVRNTAGNERSQESLRYVRLTDIRFWIPPIIAREKEEKLLPSWPGSIMVELYKLTPTDIFEHVVETCEWAQKALAKYYDIENVPSFERKKLLTSAFRRVAPIGLATGIVISFGMRSLRWVIEQRTAPFAEEEMRYVIGLIAEDAMRRWPMLVQDFEKIDTGDGLFWYKPKYSKI